MVHPKQNASRRGGAHADQAGGLKSTGQNKVFRCSVHHISKLRRELQSNGLGLRETTGRTQCETLLRVLQYLGERGANTKELEGLGYYRAATRVHDLEANGWLIASQRENLVGVDGLYHKGIARYVLIGQRSNWIDPQGSLDLGDPHGYCLRCGPTMFF